MIKYHSGGVNAAVYKITDQNSEPEAARLAVSLAVK